MSKVYIFLIFHVNFNSLVFYHLQMYLNLMESDESEFNIKRYKMTIILLHMRLLERYF